MRAAALLGLALLLAGCTAPPAPAPAPTPLDQPTATSGQGATPPPGKGTAAPAGNATFEPFEADLHVTLYAAIAVPDGPVTSVNSGNMADAMVDVPIPVGARTMRVVAEWTPSTPLSAQLDLMVHNGTVAEPGDQLAGIVGGPPLETEAIPIPDGAPSLVIMCHVAASPAGAEANQDVHVRAVFA